MENDKELEIVRKEVVGFVPKAQALAVVTKEDYSLAIALRNTIKDARNRWTAYWKPVKDSAYATWKGLCAKENEGTAICDSALALIDSKAMPWKQEAERKAAEEQRRLQAEADERSRRERERLEKEAAKLKTPEKIEERLEQAAAVVTPVITVESPVAGIEGAGSRKTWKAELVSKEALIESAKPGTVSESLLEFNQKAGDAFARSVKGKIAIPGVKFFEVESFIRGRQNGE